jgi:hypothetical protein
MNYDRPRELKSGGWKYTRMNDGKVWAIGYCGDHEPHVTADEARECYTSYLLDERLRLDVTVDSYNPCMAEGCETLTNRCADIDGWHMFRLCDEHRDREHVAALFGTAGDSMHS